MPTRQPTSLFLHINDPPNPDVNRALWEYRLKQRRPISRNPFEPEDTHSSSYRRIVSDSLLTCPNCHSSLRYDDGGLGTFVADDRIKPNYITQDTTASKKNMDQKWGERAPRWLTLAVYDIDFYADDWFHMLCGFLTLAIFGALAAATQDFDIRNYILRSPGSSELVPYNISTITPEQYSAERLAKVSIRVIMISVTMSRRSVLLLIQHLRVAIYAKVTSKSKQYPVKLLIVPATLFLSAALFSTAFRITMNGFGPTPLGTKIVYILWGVALLVEVIAHIARFQMEIGEGDGIKLRSHRSITKRLTDVTTILIGEGINAIAGSFHAIEKAPGFRSPTATKIVCCAVIVFFLVFLYFNGPAPLKSVRRRAAWVMMHLPWLLTVILLLEGMKNQLLLQSFLASYKYMNQRFEKTAQADLSASQFEAAMRHNLLQGGLLHDDEIATFMNMLKSNTSLSPDVVNSPDFGTNPIVDEISGVWANRMQLKWTLNTYITFMGNDSIPSATYETISRYLVDYGFALEDFQRAQTTGGYTPHLVQIFNELVGPNLDSVRYIMAMCGGTFITLASLNLIQSWPRDRFHWGSILSRYAVGIIMLLLLLLNIGKSQIYIEPPEASQSERAGFLRWVDAGMLLPTLALAYIVQFIVDTVLFYLAVRSSRKALGPAIQMNDMRRTGSPSVMDVII
ncbi:hypothetical protein FRC07_002083 [Ceratobasidium sp. 392]|nr:hypothetical protein FRC07_002083 [Ceratobasidium sp. 392]